MNNQSPFNFGSINLLSGGILLHSLLLLSTPQVFEQSLFLSRYTRVRRRRGGGGGGGGNGGSGGDGGGGIEVEAGGGGGGGGDGEDDGLTAAATAQHVQVVQVCKSLFLTVWIWVLSRVFTCSIMH